jgi:hypothetical protein
LQKLALSNMMPDMGKLVNFYTECAELLTAAWLAAATKMAKSFSSCCCSSFSQRKNLCSNGKKIGPTKIIVKHLGKKLTDDFAFTHIIVDMVIETTQGKTELTYPGARELSPPKPLASEGGAGSPGGQPPRPPARPSLERAARQTWD